MKKLALILILSFVCASTAFGDYKKPIDGYDTIELKKLLTGNIPPARSVILTPTAHFDATMGELTVNPSAENVTVQIEIYGECGLVAFENVVADGSDIHVSVPDLMPGWYSIIVSIGGYDFGGEFAIGE